jgi:hypothetical protein
MRIQLTDKKRRDFAGEGNPLRITNIYEVVEIERCELFQDCKGENNKFEIKPIEEFKQTEEMKQQAINSGNAFREEHKEHIENQNQIHEGELYIDDDFSEIYNNNAKYITVGPNVYKLKVNHCLQLKKIYLHDYTNIIYIDDCFKINELKLYENIVEIRIENCTISELIFNGLLKMKKIYLYKCKINNIDLSEGKLLNVNFSDCPYLLNIINVNTNILDIENCNNLISLKNIECDTIYLTNCKALKSEEIHIESKMLNFISLNKINLSSFPADIPNFTDSIRMRNCIFTNKEITLPNELVTLEIFDSEIDILNINSQKLKTLIIRSDKIKNITNLPDSLEHLEIIGSGLTKLPDLPEKLKHLILICDGLTYLSNIPLDLQYTKIKCKNVKNIPKIPKKIIINGRIQLKNYDSSKK